MSQCWNSGEIWIFKISENLGDQTAQSIKDRENIKYGEILIAKNGDIFGKSYQIIHAKEGDASNALARNKQLEELKNNLPVNKFGLKGNECLL